jgi:hypothetical protein
MKMTDTSTAVIAMFVKHFTTKFKGENIEGCDCGI